MLIYKHRIKILNKIHFLLKTCFTFVIVPHHNDFIKAKKVIDTHHFEVTLFVASIESNLSMETGLIFWHAIKIKKLFSRVKLN